MITIFWLTHSFYFSGRLTGCTENETPPGSYCNKCTDTYLRSDDWERCGHTCHKCSGKECDKFDQKNVESDVCDSCWVSCKSYVNLYLLYIL